MEKRKVVIAGPMAITGISLILVIKFSINCQPAGSNIFFSGIKQPVSLVVSSPRDNKAFNIEGDEIPLGRLLQEAPDLAWILEKT
jgi:hypothetical protein